MHRGLASTDHGGKVRFYVSESPVEKFAGQGKQAIPEGPHATPNSSSILPISLVRRCGVGMWVRLVWMR